MNAECAAVVESVVKEFAADGTRLMDIVHAVQQRFGHVSDDAVGAIAARLGIHAVEIEDMVSFYAFFNRKPRGRFRIRLSKTPISFIKGAKEVARAFEETLGLSFGGTSADGAFTLSLNGVPIFCRGALWVPPDAVTLGSSRAALTTSLQLLVDAGMNMVRIGGYMSYEDARRQWFERENSKLSIAEQDSFVIIHYLFALLADRVLKP